MKIEEFINDRIADRIKSDLPYARSDDQVHAVYLLMSLEERSGFLAHLLGYLGSSALKTPLSNYLRYAVKPIKDYQEGERELPAKEGWAQLPSDRIELAHMLKDLILEHKKRCKSKHCTISTMRLGLLYEFLLGDKMSKEEVGLFI